jgi:hypothetical protein
MRLSPLITLAAIITITLMPLPDMIAMFSALPIILLAFRHAIARLPLIVIAHYDDRLLRHFAISYAELPAITPFRQLILFSLMKRHLLLTPFRALSY